MNAKKLSEESTTGLRALIDEACANSQIDLPFAEVVIVGDGHHYASDLFEYSTGPRGMEYSRGKHLIKLLIKYFRYYK
jgi:hypothetical protein